MAIITFTAKNELGTKALKKHWEESRKLPMKQRMVFRASGYKHELVSEEPYTLKLTINNRYAKTKEFIKLIKSEARTTLKKNGATVSDYSMEVS